uniref:Uncharacterized protein n=1 Tax=Coturnix japonica TaxID=93934 RepID=A0A8C2SKM4_COTJA
MGLYGGIWGVCEALWCVSGALCGTMGCYGSLWGVYGGLAAGSSGYGPLRDRPDWSFVGELTPPPRFLLVHWQRSSAPLLRLRPLSHLLDSYWSIDTVLRAVSLIQSLDAVRPKGRSFPFKPLPQLRLKGPVPKSPFSPPKQ